MEDIKEVKEALVALNELAVFFAKRFKDGVQFADGVAFFEVLKEDAVFKAKLDAAIAGYSNIPAELGDLELSEGLELAMVQLQYVPKIVEALKAE